ncbi:MAG: nucleotidyltransferase domain-containing protein [Pseudomonadota bacterium]|nr:nucleotidyltransferase domain-containing protein [Pseudomonadota bacterium]
MRLTETQALALRQLARELAGNDARLLLFGSRLDDAARGGDVDLLLDLPGPVPNPALLSARMSARASRLVNGRKVDVVIAAPNLMRLPIHEVAYREGHPL